MSLRGVILFSCAALLAALPMGCGGRAKKKTEKKPPPAKTVLMERIALLDREYEADSITHDTVISVIRALEHYHKHLRQAGIGTDEQRSRVFAFADALREAGSTGGRTDPAWQPTEKDPLPPPSGHARIVSAPFGDLLAQLRAFLEPLE